MKEGQASKTAVIAATYRALADRLRLTNRFVDPVALEWLPQPEHERIKTFPSAPPKALRDRLRYSAGLLAAKMMAARSVEVDDAVRDANNEQVVILGAGLDSRAWRMDELANAAVFEVDHPDTQRDKRARAQNRTPKAKALHYVPVDFRHDSLDDALGRAGHDPSKPTTWVWEGVVMYLTRDDVEATLRVIQRRSAPGSRLAICYMTPALMLLALVPRMKLMGEPLRSLFGPRSMSALLARYGFHATRDVVVADVAGDLSLELAADGLTARHLRVVTADRAAGGPHAQGLQADKTASAASKQG